MLLLSAILFFLSFFPDFFIDFLQFRVHGTNPWAKNDWLNPRLSWDNKWENEDPEQGPKHFGSVTFLVFLTDGWHFGKMVKWTLLESAATLVAMDAGGLKITPWAFLDYLVIAFGTKMVRAGIFTLGFEYVMPFISENSPFILSLMKKFASWFRTLCTFVASWFRTLFTFKAAFTIPLGVVTLISIVAVNTYFPVFIEELLVAIVLVWLWGAYKWFKAVNNQKDS